MSILCIWEIFAWSLVGCLILSWIPRMPSSALTINSPWKQKNPEYLFQVELTIINVMCFPHCSPERRGSMSDKMENILAPSRVSLSLHLPPPFRFDPTYFLLFPIQSWVFGYFNSNSSDRNLDGFLWFLGCSTEKSKDNCYPIVQQMLT